MKNPSPDLRRKLCRYCDAPLPEAFLDLGTLPLANSYVAKQDLGKPEFKCPLCLTWCPECKLVQLTHTVPPDLMFSNYLYVSSTTKAFQVHFADYAAMVKGKLGDRRQPLAVDIGSNDGLLLGCYKNQGMRAVGVEPAKNLAEEANRKGIRTLNRYFDSECVKSILASDGPADVISANNVFAHIDAIQPVCRNASGLLSDRGMLVIEFPYLGRMLEDLLFDMIYHEHAAYIAVTPLKYLLGRFGLEIFDIREVASHGGSLRVFVQKRGGPFEICPAVGEFLAKEEKKGYLTFAPYGEFAGKVMRVRQDFLSVFSSIRGRGKTAAGYGAPAKASTLINFYGLSAEDLLCVADDNPLKQNYFVPGTGIPIVPSGVLFENPPDFVIVFAWNFAREIFRKIAPLREKGTRFLVPLPIGNAGSGLDQTYELVEATQLSL